MRLVLWQTKCRAAVIIDFNNHFAKLGRRFDSILLSLIAFIYTLGWNWSSPGPVYLSDTVAYMVNAAILAGHKVDAMGSWHAGYSILLAPLFLMDDPFRIWKGVQIINATLVGLSIYLSGALIDQLRPNLDRASRAVALIVIILYPAFSAIAGYAFPSPLLSVNVLLISLYLVRTAILKGHQAVLLGLLAGFAYWIHPMGLAVIMATFIVLLIFTGSSRWRFVLLYLLSSAAMVWLYRNGVHETLYRLVTPHGFDRFDHYQNVGNFGDLATLDGILKSFTLFMGQLSYQLVLTLGLAWIGAWYGLRTVINWYKRGESNSRQDDVEFVIALFALLLILGAIALGVLNFSLVGLGRSDFWIYGRYTDTFVHPLLVMGLLAFVDDVRGIRGNLWIWLLAIAIVIITGIFLNQVVDVRLFHDYQMTLSFWPQYLVIEKNFLSWMLLGSFGLVLMALIGRSQKVVFIGLLLVFSSHAYLSGTHNLDERKRLETYHSQPSGIVDVIRSTWPRGTCVGFANPLPSGLSLIQQERYRMYAFYLFNYDYRRYTLEDWKSECMGPLFTYSPASVHQDSKLNFVLREESSGLLLVSRVDKTPMMQPDVLSRLGGVEVIKDLSAECFNSGCFARSAHGLAKASQVGVLEAGSLKTDGRSGFLFYGPYTRIAAGQYELVLDIDVKVGNQAVIDVVGASATQTYARLPLANSMSAAGMAKVTFSISEPVNDLEIRLEVGDGDELSVSGYKLQLATVSE